MLLKGPYRLITVQNLRNMPTHFSKARVELLTLSALLRRKDASNADKADQFLLALFQPVNAYFRIERG
jgi:hypothetical protein